MRLFFLAFLVILASCSTLPVDQRAVSEELRTFRDLDDLQAYLEALDERHVQESAEVWAVPAPQSGDTITVTGSRVANETITNNQVAGVDEGDVVKKIGNHLVVLQDGRLFSVGLRDGDAPIMELSGRTNVYDEPDVDTWYDELLVSGDRVVVTGYSYDAEATEVTLLRMRPEGSFERQGRFYLSSDDYYDTENYATRMIGSRLVMHTPIYLSDIDLEGDQPFPVIIPDRSAEEVSELIGARPLFGTEDIYRPVAHTGDPVLHAITFCDLDQLVPDFDPEAACQTTAFIGSDEYTTYVDGEASYVWSTYWRDGKDKGEATVRAAAPGSFHRVSLDDGELRVAAVAGTPFNQFSFLTRDRSMAVLTRLNEAYSPGDQRLALLRLPKADFGDTYTAPSAQDYALLPPIDGGYDVKNRFTDDHLVFTTSGDYLRPIYMLRGVADYGRPEETFLHVVDIDQPRRVQKFALPHTVTRLDRAGPTDAVVMGYKDGEGLTISYIDLDEAPSIASRVTLMGRYESEARSHAYVPRIGADGGVFGLPTVGVEGDSRRSWSFSDFSDLSFVRVSADGSMSDLGWVESSRTVHADYGCEVSCIDWYGNARPIFADGRVFALSATELMEVTLADKAEPVGRLDLTAPLEKDKR